MSFSNRQAILELAQFCFREAKQTFDRRLASELRRIGEGFLRVAEESAAT